MSSEKRPIGGGTPSGHFGVSIGVKKALMRETITAFAKRIALVLCVLAAAGGVFSVLLVLGVADLRKVDLLSQSNNQRISQLIYAVTQVDTSTVAVSESLTLRISGATERTYIERYWPRKGRQGEALSYSGISAFYQFGPAEPSLLVGPTLMQRQEEDRVVARLAPRGGGYLPVGENLFRLNYVRQGAANNGFGKGVVGKSIAINLTGGLPTGVEKFELFLNPPLADQAALARINYRAKLVIKERVEATDSRTEKVVKRLIDVATVEGQLVLVDDLTTTAGKRLIYLFPEVTNLKPQQGALLYIDWDGDL